jgi:hypothetical protein
MGYFQHRGPGKLNRERSDSLARGLKSSPPVFLTAAGGCKLSRDPVTGFLDGTTGDSVNLTINGTSGSARFLDVTYAGTSIAGAGTTATMTVKTGEKILRCVVDAIPGDTVQLKESPCGAVLDSVIFDNGNPVMDDLHIVGT